VAGGWWEWWRGKHVLEENRSVWEVEVEEGSWKHVYGRKMGREEAVWVCEDMCRLYMWSVRMSVYCQCKLRQSLVSPLDSDQPLLLQ